MRVHKLHVGGSGALIEMAEALQALGGYLGAMQRDQKLHPATPPQQEMMQRAIDQCARACRAMHELKAHLRDHV